MAFQYVLPSAVSGPLESLRQRVRQIAILRGVGLFLLLGTSLFAGVLAADFLLDFQPSSRLAALIVLLVGEAALAGWCIGRPVFRRLPDTELASLAEQRFPELRERVSSLVEFSDPNVPESQKGSRLMRELLEGQTVEELQDCDFDEAVSTTPAVRRLSFGLGVVCFLAMTLMVFPSPSKLLLARLFSPLGNYASVSRLMFDVQNGEPVVARGTDVTISAGVHWRTDSEEPVPEPVELHWLTEAGETDTRDLQFDPETGTFSAIVPAVQDPFEFFVTADGSRSERFHINVVDPPQVVAAKLEVTPPGYLGEPMQTVDGATGEIDVFERSQLRFELTFNKPVHAAHIDWTAPMVVPGTEAAAEAVLKDDEVDDVERRTTPYTNQLVRLEQLDPTELKLAEDGLSATLEMPAEIQAVFAFRLTDEFGLTNNDEPHRQFVVTRDQPPLLDVPGDIREEARPDDVYVVNVEAVDDVGLDVLELHMTSREGLNQTLTPEREQLGGQSIAHSFRLDLADLALRVGDVIQLQVRAVDGRPIPAPNEIWSEPRLLSISENASAQGAGDVLARQGELRKELQKLRADLEAAEEVSRKAAENTRDLLVNGREPDSEAVQTIVDAETGLADRIGELADAFAEHPLFANIADETRELTTDELQPAVDTLADAAEGTLREHLAAFNQNTDAIENVERALAGLETEFEELADLENDLLELRRIAERSSQLAEDAVALNQREQELQQRANGELLQGETQQDVVADQQDLAEDGQALAEEHNELLQALEELMQQRPELLDAARDHQLEKLGELAEQARELAEPQDLLADALQQNVDDVVADVAPIAEQQQELAERVERLAAQANANQGRQPVEPIDPELARQIVDELQQGNLEEAQELQQQAADDLMELFRELAANDELPENPREAARELARLQREVADDIEAAAEVAQGRAPADGDDAPDIRELAAREAALQMAAAQLETQRSARDEQQQAVNEAAESVQDLIRAAEAQQASDAAQAANANPDNGQPPADSSPSNPAAAQALQQAAQNSQAAADALDELAEAIRDPGEVRQEAADALEQIRGDQDLLENEAVAQARPENAERLANDDPETTEQLQRLADDQLGLARQLAELDVPGADVEQRQAVEAAAQALDDLADERVADVPASQRELQQALENLEKRLDGELTSREQVELLLREHRQLTRNVTQLFDDPAKDRFAELADREQDFAGRAGEIPAPAAERAQENAVIALLEASGELSDAAETDAIRAALRSADSALQDFAAALSPNGRPQPEDPGEFLEQLAQQQQQAAEQAAEQAEAGEAAAAANEAAAQQLADAVDQLERLRPGDAAQGEKLEALDQLRKAQEKQEQLAEQLAQDETGNANPDPNSPDPGEQLRDMLAQNAEAQQDALDALERLERELQTPAPEPGQPADNVDNQNADLAQQLADLLGEPEPEPQQIADMAQNLAEQQANLREEVAQLDNEANPQPGAEAQPNQPTPDGGQPSDPAGAQPGAQELADQQANLNEQAGELPLDVGALERAEALEQLAQAEQSLENGNLEQAQAAQQQAEQALQNLAREAQALAEAQQPNEPAGGEQFAQADAAQQAGAEPAGQPPQEPGPGAVPGGEDPGQQLANEAAALAEMQQQLEQQLADLAGEASNPGQQPSDAGAPQASDEQPGSTPAGSEGQQPTAGEPGSPGQQPSDAGAPQASGEQPGSAPAGSEGQQPTAGEPGSPGQQPSDSGAPQAGGEQPGSAPAGSEGQQPTAGEPGSSGQQPSDAGAPQAGGEPPGDSPAGASGQPGLEQLQAQQQELAAAAAQMALDAAQELGGNDAATQAAAEAAQSGQQAAASAQGAQPGQAAQQASQAAQAAEAAASAMAESAPGMAQQAQELAAQQQQLAEDFESIANDPEQLAAAQQQQQQQFADQAAQLAESLDELAQTLGQQPLGLDQQGQSAASAQQAAQQGQSAAQQSAQSMQAGNPGSAAQAAQQAAQSLQQAAQQAGQAAQSGASGEQSPVPGELAAQVAEAMRQLQQAQQQFGQAAPSQNGESGSPVDSGQPLGQEPGNTSSSGTPSQGSLAGNGTQSSGGTPSGGGSEQPPTGPQSPGSQSQGQSSGSEPSPNGQSSQPSGPPSPDGQGSSGGQSGGGQSSQSQNSALAQASQSLQQAAQALQQAAQQMTGQGSDADRDYAGSDAQSSNVGGGEGGTGVAGELSPLEQQLQKQAMKNWGKLPGKLKTEILQSAQRKANGDYAKLIKLYFEEIATAGQRAGE